MILCASRPTTLLAVTLALTVGLPLVLALSGCPRLPPVSGCTPRSQSCRDGAPYVCSASQRWEPAGDTTCAAVGGACVMSAAGVAFCAPVRDGGSDADR